MQVATDTELTMPARYRPLGVGRRGHLTAWPAPSARGRGASVPTGAACGVGR